MHGELTEKFIDELKADTFSQARDAQKWIEKCTRKKLTEGGMRKLIHCLGGKVKMSRKSHRKRTRLPPTSDTSSFRSASPKWLAKIPTSPCAFRCLTNTATGCCQ